MNVLILCVYEFSSSLCVRMCVHPGLLPVTNSTVRLHRDTVVHLVSLPWARSDISPQYEQQG